MTTRWSSRAQSRTQGWCRTCAASNMLSFRYATEANVANWRHRPISDSCCVSAHLNDRIMNRAYRVPDRESMTTLCAGHRCEETTKGHSAPVDHLAFTCLPSQSANSKNLTAPIHSRLTTARTPPINPWPPAIDNSDPAIDSFRARCKARPRATRSRRAFSRTCR